MPPLLSLILLFFSSSFHSFISALYFFFFFSFIGTSTSDTSTLSLHDALPISLYSLSQQDLYRVLAQRPEVGRHLLASLGTDRKSTRLNSSHVAISYAVFCLKKKKKTYNHLICHR